MGFNLDKNDANLSVYGNKSTQLLKVSNENVTLLNETEVTQEQKIHETLKNKNSCTFQQNQHQQLDICRKNTIKTNEKHSKSDEEFPHSESHQSSLGNTARHQGI